MTLGLNPCLTVAIAPLTTGGSESFALWVTNAPVPSGYVHHDSLWSETLTRKWLAWQEMFAPQGEPHLPVNHDQLTTVLPPLTFTLASPMESYGGRLMQELGLSLWQWLFDASIHSSFAQSRGLALGSHRPLRLRLDIQAPQLIPLPWEIMQSAAGKQTISLDPQILFSRTTNNVDPLVFHQAKEVLNILLVLGNQTHPSPASLNEITNQADSQGRSVQEADGLTHEDLKLETEANLLAQMIEDSSFAPQGNLQPPVTVHPLVQPTPSQLIDTLDSGDYNVLFYAGHGMPAPNGGLLFLSSQATMNGTELAQVLIRNQITLAVFNACWGAQPDHQGSKTIERSSLAEVLIHHGVPAVLAMRDSIADQEALSFIQALTKALTQRQPIDEAVRFARQQLLTLYKFNQPAWTLPILYMHPQFNGELIAPLDDITQLPLITTKPPAAYLRFVEEEDTRWQIYGGLMRVGRRPENDLVIQEKWVSQRHAEIICREVPAEPEQCYTYFLRDFSRFGTLILKNDHWQRVHYEEVPLSSGTQLKFGSPYGQTVEFIVEEIEMTT
ncbi:CHAT domain-containing protein [Crocosphaera sp. XPORK-15E]|uniref:CHAT domain-containing protein n=1 Tax=Crocosphaera sp. XPORK-15E TaxID=3110247 RepID=UPI002B1FB8D1|nr:CHAT domain-containing protein [Crocosphaera sp. XPORK-15E]MEA5536312.1 CHAT domain-containing protein [Crocosphaera sp. XPORK-15E]